MHFYRYITALDITRLFYAPTSLTHVREILSQLAGSKDYADRQYLFRFPLPHTHTGNTEKIYTLGAKGRAFLQESGMEVDWYFRPSDASSLTYQHLTHALTLTHFLIAAQVYCRERDDLRLPTVMTEYTLNREAPLVAITEGKETRRMKVVPDAWLNFELLEHGQHLDWSPVLLEIDRGTEQQKYFKRHIASRIEFTRRNGAYKQLFGTSAVTIAYATTGNEARLTNMIQWTQEVLRDLNKQSYADVFRFCRLPQGVLDGGRLLAAPSWVGLREPTPVRLLFD